MAPIKFEEDIKHKFEGRKIQPSAQAWEKISGQLNTITTAKKSGYQWYAIAASVIGLLIATLVFFNAGKEAVIQGKPIVNTPQNKINKELQQSKEKQINIFDTKETIVNNTDDNLRNIKKVNSGAVHKSTSDNEAVAIIIDDLNEPKLQQENKANQEINALINEKINAIVAQVDALALQKSTVTDSEIDALLRKAQDEILAQKIFKNSNSVDAMALLNQAETELDLSVRDQLFEALKSGYLKVRTAVADRNK
jgi:uncharacterized protein (DUF1778 family)